MNRRSFLQGNVAPLNAFDDPVPPQTPPPADLTPYVPSAEKPWDIRRAAHLLRRAGFGPTWEEAAAAVASTPAAVVDALLKEPDFQPELHTLWTDQYPFDESIPVEERSTFYNTWLRDLQFWWIGMMLEPASRLREKMVLFWHGHFVSEFPKVEATQHMYHQNRLFREYAFGSFLELTKKVTVDPAMLIYLDGNGSTAGSPNENYARELMELFTLGVGTYGNGTHHYTEQDVIQMARALTGWKVVNVESQFDPEHFDAGPKTIFGQTANFGVDASAARNVIDLIFEQIDTDWNQRRAAIFICTKLYEFFVLQTPTMAIIDDMAKTLIDNDWKVGPVLRQLFLSEHFFDDSVIGGLIKSPVDFVMGNMSSFKLQITVNADPGPPEGHDPLRAMSFLSQTIFLPPNVKGWIGGKNWITTATLPMRVRYSKLWIDPPQLDTTAPYDFKPVEFVKSIADSDDVHKLVDNIVALVLPIPISDRAKKTLTDTLLGGAPDYEWQPDQFETKIRAFMIALLSLAEHQLM
jgi:uncharacterized protein (DUF1800 family)